MGKLRNDQAGFSAIETVLVLVIIGLIGVVGLMVYKNHNKTNTTKPAAVKMVVPLTTNSSITSGPGADWNTYTNNKLGFSIQIPKQFLSSNGAECTKVTYVYDNYGNKVPSMPNYIPAQGVVPTTVIEEGNDFYIAEAYTYQTTNRTSDSTGHQLASGCQKVQTTASVIDNYKKLADSSSYLLDVLPLSVTTVSNQQDVLNWAQNYFNDKTITMSLSNDSSGKWQNVSLDCNSGQGCTDFGFKFYLRYYKTQGKLVYLEQGQSGHLQKSAGGSFYDDQIFSSFKLTN